MLFSLMSAITEAQQVGTNCQDKRKIVWNTTNVREYFYFRYMLQVLKQLNILRSCEKAPAYQKSLLNENVVHICK